MPVNYSHKNKEETFKENFEFKTTACKQQTVVFHAFFHFLLTYWKINDIIN